MGFFKSVIAKIGAAEEKPVVRVRGLFRWSRRLVVYMPGADHPSLHAIPLGEAGNVEFRLHEGDPSLWHVQFRGLVISTHSSKEEALHMLDLLANAIAPSKWRYAIRLLLAWIVFSIFLPSQSEQPPVLTEARPTPGIVPYIAPQAERSSFGAETQRSMPAQLPSPVTAINDPFGLQITPDGK